MNGINLPMALVDFIPVLLFAATAVLLMRDLYNKMSKGAFALFAAGTLMIIIAGAYKALWKLLYALNICDFVALNRCFFPLQATGFLLAFIALVALLTHKQGNTAYAVAAPFVYESSMIFVVLNVIGTFGICGCLCVAAKRMKRPLAIVLFLLSCVFMLTMGYLSSRDFTQASMNWIAQGTNILGQGALLFGSLILHKAGLEEPDALQKGAKA